MNEYSKKAKSATLIYYLNQATDLEELTLNKIPIYNLEISSMYLSLFFKIIITKVAIKTLIVEISN